MTFECSKHFRCIRVRIDSEALPVDALPLEEANLPRFLLFLDNSLFNKRVKLPDFIFVQWQIRKRVGPLYNGLVMGRYKGFEPVVPKLPPLKLCHLHAPVAPVAPLLREDTYALMTKSFDPPPHCFSLLLVFRKLV